MDYSSVGDKDNVIHDSVLELGLLLCVSTSESYSTFLPPCRFLFVCLFVCQCVSKITQKVMDRSF